MQISAVGPSAVWTGILIQGLASTQQMPVRMQHKVNPELAEKLSQNKKFLFYINVEPLSFLQNLSEKRLIEPLIL